MNKNVVIAGAGIVIVILVMIVTFALGDEGIDLDREVYTDPSTPTVTTDEAVSEQNQAVDQQAQTRPTQDAAEPPSATQPAAQEDTSRPVYFNGRQLTQEDLAEIKQTYGIDAVPGNYWYDTVSGAFGNMGGPVVGVMYPGHNFGQLSANASNGTSGVFYNGRQLTNAEATAIAGLFGVAPIPGRYWFDAFGNVGIEGSGTALVNVYAAAAAAGGGGGGGGDNFWSKGLYSAGNYYTGAGGQITEGYVSVPGYGPVSHGF